MEKIVIGIDLGTTCCSVSFTQSNEIKIIEDKSRNYRVPSVVHFSKDNDPDIGENAEDFLGRDPKNTIFDSKRMIGRKYDDPEIQKLIPYWPFRIEKKPDDGKILICLDELGLKVEPYEVSGHLLKYLSKIGNDCLETSQKTNEVIITVPANFCDEQRHDTKRAAEFAGLKVLQLLNEPTAAGIDFGIDKKSDNLLYVIVFDFGGGTLDVSLMSLQDNEPKIIQTDGDMFLGGRNFDENLVNYFINKLNLSQYLRNERNKQRRMKILREKAIKTKEKLSERDSVDVEIEFNDELFFEITVTLNEFEEINKDLIERIFLPIERLLQSSKMRISQINQILLVGGSSNMKFVKRELEKKYNIVPFLHTNSGSAVARGAAFVAKQYATGKNRCIDVVSHSIGVQILGGVVSTLIKKGDNLPANGMKSYKTVLYRQESVDINVYEGFSKKVEEDCLLGTFSILNIPQSKHFITFVIRLTLDENGLLLISAELPNQLIKGKIIKKSNNFNINHQFKSENIEDLKKKIYLENIERFVRHKRKALIKFYDQDYLQKIMFKVKILKEDNSLVDLMTICSTFEVMLQKYILAKDDKAPDFLKK